MNKMLLGALGAVLLVSGCAGTHSTKCEAFREVFKQNKVYFATDKADLTPEAKKILSTQVAWMKDNPSKKIILQGYADPRGTPQYNMRLGEKRAEAVKNYFVQAGINPNRITVISFGDTDLASTQNDPHGWSKDRRAVTVIVTE